MKPCAVRVTLPQVKGDVFEFEVTLPNISTMGVPPAEQIENTVLNRKVDRNLLSKVEKHLSQKGRRQLVFESFFNGPSNGGHCNANGML